jgi:hypothetical protein
MSLASPPRNDYVPLSERPSHELYARAAELVQMAATARTADARTALETLATRFAALAAKRELAEALEMANRAAADNDQPVSFQTGAATSIR